MSDISSIFPDTSAYDDYVETWYPLISDFTFKTWVFNFTKDEGILLHRIAIQTIKKKPITKIDQISFNKFYSKVSTFFEKVKDESPPNSGYFLRLGSRSLKDASFCGKNCFKRLKSLLYQKYLDEYNLLKLETKDDKIKWVNEKSQMKDLYYINECDIKSLKCYTLSDMFELFFNSERIIFDLFDEIKKESPKFSLNFRLWDDRLTYQMEFRGFIYHHKFCALTQYDHRMYYDQVYENKEIILNSITDLYEQKIKPSMESNCPFPGGTYVIDFGVIFNSPHEVSALVIEINRFAKSTGSSLFSWEEDIDILTGKKDFEFRLVDKNYYNNVDYESVLHPNLILLKNKIKEKIINKNKSFIEKHFTWRKKCLQ